MKDLEMTSNNSISSVPLEIKIKALAIFIFIFLIS